jgi:hypothetical protein
MSLPSDDWREAGLAEPDELDPANPLLADGEAERGEDYHPGTARPDLEDQAAEADVVEQAYEVEVDDDGDDDDGDPAVT